MIAQAQGIIKSLIETKSGMKRDGKEWEKKTFLIQTNDDEVRNSLITADLFSGDGPVVYAPSIGATVQLTLSITASQYNGKWFNHIAIVHFSEIKKD